MIVFNEGEHYLKLNLDKGMAIGITHHPNATNTSWVLFLFFWIITVLIILLQYRLLDSLVV